MSSEAKTADKKEWKAEHTKRFAALVSEMEVELGIKIQADITIHGGAKIKIGPFDSRPLIVTPVSAFHKDIGGEYKCFADLELKRNDLVDAEFMKRTAEHRMVECPKCFQPTKLEYGGLYSCKRGHTGRLQQAEHMDLWFGLEINLAGGTIENEHGTIATIQMK